MTTRNGDFWINTRSDWCYCRVCLCWSVHAFMHMYILWHRYDNMLFIIDGSTLIHNKWNLLKLCVYAQFFCISRTGSSKQLSWSSERTNVRPYERIDKFEYNEIIKFLFKENMTQMLEWSFASIWQSIVTFCCIYNVESKTKLNIERK